jgi:hypothetical protein
MTIPARGDHEAAEKIYVVNGERLTLTEFARLMVEQTRAAQGLPFHVEDPATLRRIAQLIKRPRKDGNA